MKNNENKQDCIQDYNSNTIQDITVKQGSIVVYADTKITDYIDGVQFTDGIAVFNDFTAGHIFALLNNLRWKLITDDNRYNNLLRR